MNLYPLLTRANCRNFQIVCILAVSLGFGHRLAAQIPATTLQAHIVPKITITGLIGSVQELQYSTNLADTNAWTTLTSVRLGATSQDFYDSTANGEKRFYRTVTVTLADTNLVWISPGTFLMGSPSDEQARSTNEGPQTLVTLTKGFYMGRFEVRNSEWFEVTGALPYGESGESNFWQMPVHFIAWYDATNYCALRTAAEAAAGKIPAGWSYRLPTEAEWEYACRAGSTTAFYLGNELRSDSVRTDAAFDGNFPYPTNSFPIEPVRYTHLIPGGNFVPNAFGLYDMYGNAEEWCLDTFSSGNLPGYAGGAVTDPVHTGGIYAVTRGGNSSAHADRCRSAARTSIISGPGGAGTGLRVVLAQSSP
jgi:formylglycine-generating enzyme required for sulfatase activity